MFRKTTSAKAALLAALALSSITSSAYAAIVCGPTANLPIPANLDGVYLNLVTGANGPGGAGVAGWDFNGYLTGGTLFFFWPSAPANSSGGVATGTVYNVLPANAPIGPAQTFSVSSGGGGSANYVNWLAANGDNFLGVRFFNEATAAINYGWMRLNTTAPTGFPATIVQYCYQNDGTQILAGDAGGGGANTAPTLTYSPTTAAGVTFPAGAAGSVNATIAISSAGAAGTGQSAVTGCAITGAGAASFGAVTTTPANGIFNTGTTSGSINLSCTRGAAAASASLACTETATPAVAGSPFTRTWALTCPAATVVAPPAISLAATVGTTPAVCATTDTLTVTAGTEVHYCYTVTNTGTVAVTSHDLNDTVTGTILNDFPFNLLPGASAFLVVPATPAATVTNTGVWTATTGSTYTVNAAAPFSYIPINATGTALNLTDDAEANIVSPFPITYFGVTSNNLRVGNNGGIRFNVTTGDVGFTNAALPNAAHPLTIFPFWDDLNGSTGNVYWQVQGAAPNRQLIVEWFQRSHFSVAGNTATFQVVISEGSNEIRFQYLDVDFGSATINNGASATVGLNVSATVAQQVSFNTDSLANNQTILFTPPQSATATDSTTLTVLIPNIDVSPASLTAGAPVNQTTTAPLTIANTGQGNLNWNIAEEPVVGQPQTTPPGRGTRSDARDEVSEPLNKPGEPAPAVAPVSGPIWRAPDAVLYDNGPLVTNPGAGAGGANVSALQLTQSILGFGHAVTTGFRMADDFVVGGSGWLINTVTFFAYQTGSTTTSTIDAVNVRIWDGPPGAPGSTVVFGDTTTNRLVSSAFANVYRTDNTLAGTTRPVMASVVAINTFLPAGTYWFDWQTGGTLASGPWAPAVTLAGQLAKPGANALQFDPTAMTWGPATDTGAAAQQDLPFVIDGLADCANLSDVPWLSLSQTAGTNAGGTSTAITASFNATGLAVGNYSARLCATSNDPDAGPGNGTGLVVVPVSFNVAASADLAMTLTDAPDPVTAGTNLTYTGTVTNNGPTAANNVSFTLPLPAGTSFVSATASGGGSCAGTPVVCTWAGSTAVGASNSATITALVAPSVAQGATLTATATATSADFDPNLANNAATTTTAVTTSADLQVVLTSSVATTPINVPVTFTANSLNLGPSDAQGVSVTVTLTPDFRYSSHVATGATCTVPQVGTTGAIVCTWAGPTAPGVTRTLSVVAFSNVQGQTVVNASTTSSTNDPVPGNNTSSVTVTVGYLVEEIPTLGNLGLLLMALMMGLMGFVAVRRQS